MELLSRKRAAGVFCGCGWCTFARAGLTEEVLALLEKTFAPGSDKRDWIEYDPDYNRLRDHPCFEAMLAKLH